MRPKERIPKYIELLKTYNNFIPAGENNLSLSSDTLDYLEKIWIDNPDWRFTQLCVNTSFINNSPGSWYYEEDLPFMLNLGFPIREILFWGTFGKDGRQPRKNVLLKEMTDEHIQAIIDTQKQLSVKTLQFFIDELALRKEHPKFSIKE